LSRNLHRRNTERGPGGAKRLRTADLRRARAALSQLSYSPGNPFAIAERCEPIPSGLVGLGGLEPPTLRLSGARSNHLSYRPAQLHPEPHPTAPSKLGRRDTDLQVHRPWRSRVPPEGALDDLLRKEVIQPQVPLRLPCYDFTPITNHTFGACPPCGLAQRLLVQLTFVV
jgi:hypothetical protein